MQETELAVAPPSLEDVSRPQRERLAFIDFSLFFLGELRRSDLASKFETGPSGATRDIALYRALAPDNCELDNSLKTYKPLQTFRPLFKHSARRVLTVLSEGFGEGIGEGTDSLVRSEVPTPLAEPKPEVIAPISRAIHQGLAVRLHYTSVESGRTEKTLVPIALVNTGVRWHARAYDRLRKEFRDYVLTRMENPVVLEDSPATAEETVNADTQWTRVIRLPLIPHPNHRRPEVVAMDYGMTDGILMVPVRAANAGYMLQRWSVDCSPDHSLTPSDHPLWLSDSLVLYGANAVLAPGYVDPKDSTNRNRPVPS